MIKGKGVYTTKCPKCTRSIVMHVLADGSISPNSCPDCEIGFGSLDKGKERNSFVITLKTEKPESIVSKDDKDEKSSTNFFQMTKKDSKKSFSSFQINKKK